MDSSANSVDKITKIVSGDTLSSIPLNKELPLLESRSNTLMKSRVLEVHSNLIYVNGVKQVKFKYLKHLTWRMENRIVQILSEMEAQDTDDLLYSIIDYTQYKNKIVSFLQLLKQINDSEDTLVSLKSFTLVAIDYAIILGNKKHSKRMENWIRTSPNINFVKLIHDDYENPMNFDYEAIPSFYSLHPETIAYLASKDIYSYEISETPRAFDLEVISSPYTLLYHEFEHQDTLQSKGNFSKLYVFWLKFINHPKISLRERELAIFIFHYQLFEIPLYWDFTDLNHQSFLLYVNDIVLVNEASIRSRFLETVNSADGIGSKLFLQKNVTLNELLITGKKIRSFFLHRSDGKTQ